MFFESSSEEDDNESCSDYDDWTTFIFFFLLGFISSFVKNSLFFESSSEEDDDEYCSDYDDCTTFADDSFMIRGFQGFMYTFSDWFDYAFISASVYFTIYSNFGSCIICLGFLIFS